MATTFKYASQSDLKNYFNNFGDFDQKIQIFGGWESLGNNVYISNNTGYTSQLFFDGGEQAVAVIGGDNATTTNTDGITDSVDDEDTTAYGIINVNSATGMRIGDILVCGGDGGTTEYVLITAISTNALTVKRGINGSTPVTILDDALVSVYISLTEAHSWFYDSSLDAILLYSTTDPTDSIIESGTDFSTFADQQLVNASLELNNLLDARFQMPLPKSSQIVESVAAGMTPEYDPIIVKCTCYIAAANLIRAKDVMSEEGQFYMDMVTNADGTGLVDKLNAGHIKLSFEIDNKDSQGSIREITRTGSMYLVETAGEFYGGKNGYDLLKIQCTTQGAYGIARCKVSYYGNDKLLGQEETDLIPTGGIDYWGSLGGIGVRFQGVSMAVGDRWEIEVYSEGMEETNSVVRNINLYR